VFFWLPNFKKDEIAQRKILISLIFGFWNPPHDHKTSMSLVYTRSTYFREGLIAMQEVYYKLRIVIQ